MTVEKKQTWSEFHAHPNAHWHAAVVHHMQGRDMLVLLAQNEEQL